MGFYENEKAHTRPVFSCMGFSCEPIQSRWRWSITLYVYRPVFTFAVTCTGG